MKKSLMLTIILILISVFSLNYYNYLRYSRATNDFVNGVISEIKRSYPQVSEEEILKLVNNTEIGKENILKDYGFSSNDISILNAVTKTYHQSVIVSIILTSFIVIIIIALNVFSYYKQKKELRKIIIYLKKLNRGIYNLEIIDNKEEITSELKSEIYKTTIMLREKALKELDDKKKLKDSLANISHQLKTPLTSILIMLDNLSDEDMDKVKRLEFLNDIKSQIENINFLILSMLKLSKFDANVIKFNSDKIIAQKLFIEVLKNVDIIRDLKDINIHVKGSSNVSFNGDFKWELEAFTNIIKNAIEHTPNSRNIYINYEENNVFTKIIIVDEGKGVDSKQINHIFDRFFKGDDTTENNFGIGLALAKEIIEHDKGSIRVSNDLEKGAKFVIKFYH